MRNKTYLVIIAYENANGNGINYQIIDEKNKERAVVKALKKLENSICVVISVKRVPKKIMEIIQKHNEKVTEAPNE